MNENRMSESEENAVTIFLKQKPDMHCDGSSRSVEK